MKEFTIGKNEDGKRLDAVAALIIPNAGKGFVYRMLRKKNIVLNDRKAEGNERVRAGDVIKFYFSDETFEGFAGTAQSGTDTDAPDGFGEMIVYQDEDIMLINKPAGMLSQKADASDVSVNELMIAYLVANGKMSEDELKTFRPSVCNRLDRNTSGIVCAGISLKGTRELTQLIRDRKIGKYYLCIVCGEVIKQKVCLRSFLSKDEKNNRVRVSKTEFEGALPVEIEYSTLKAADGYSLLKVRLITGKSHQIRAQLASVGFPIAGDTKYGSKTQNDFLRKKYGIKRQLLTAYSLEFPDDTCLERVRSKTFTIPVPEDFFIGL